MKWLKKWSYLLVFLCAGMVYLTCVDEWQVYAKPLSQIGTWIGQYTGSETAGNNADGEPSAGNAGEEVGEGTADGEPSAGNAGEDTVEGTADEEPSAGNTGEEVGEGTVDGEPSVGNTDEEVGEGTVDGEPSAGNAGEDTVEGTTDGENQGVEPEKGHPPVYVTVEDDYFTDAVFIGDSRTVGMFEYGGLEEISTFYATEGMSVYKFYTEKVISLPGRREKVTVEEALQEQSFAKVYLMLGINEMGGDVEVFAEMYAQVLARIQELQPDAIIYVQSIMKVSAKRSAKGDYITNEGIETRNALIESFADNRNVFYLDINPPVCDEGGMIADYTFDGVHLKAKYIELWKQFLKEHAVSMDEEPDLQPVLFE